MRTLRCISYLMVFIVVVAVDCGCRRTEIYANAKTAPPGRIEDYVGIVIVNDDDTLEVLKIIKDVLRPLQIRAISEGIFGRTDVAVLKRDILPAVVAIKNAPELRGRGVIIKEEYLDVIREIQAGRVR